MAYLRVPDTICDDPRFEQAGLAATGLWAIAGCWSARYNTNGHIPRSHVKRLRGTPRQVERLLGAGLWETTDDGYRFIHWRKTQDGDYRPNIRKSVRSAVFNRDGHACVWCGATDDLSLDHIVRYRDDGPDTVDNLRVLCMPCNRSREQGGEHSGS